MKIALQNSWPNVPNSAEAEWIRRALAVCEKLGFDCREVVTSDDILMFAPDCVLVTHEYSPKLTPHPTLGLLWSPCSFYAADPIRRQSILSYDGHLCASAQIVEWLEDFLHRQRKRPLIMDGLFLPSSPDCGPARDLPRELAAMYAGIHWDGNRYKPVFHGLSQCVPMNIYGPPRKWRHVGHSYRGALPFDGRSVIEAIRASGIALCLHRPEHRAYNCPSMRLLEAAAAGALIISDDFAFPRYWFRDSVLYVDTELPPALVVDQIKGHVEWACENPEAANRRARLSTELFRRSLSLDRILERVPEFVDRVRQSCRMSVASDRPCHGPTVEYILRIGSKPIKDLATALDSLANQTYRDIALTLVQLHHLEGLEEVISSYRPKFRWLRQHIVANDDERTDLNSLKADFFGVLDHGDALYPNHVAVILDHFQRYPECGLVYSGVIREQTDEGRYIDAINFQGPGDKTIAETRELTFFDSPDHARPESLYDCIQSNAWLCRSSVLNSGRLDRAADLSNALAEGTVVGFTGSPTMVRHEQSSGCRGWPDPGGGVHGSSTAPRSGQVSIPVCGR